MVPWPENKIPTFWMIAGPNGPGKSSTYSTAEIETFDQSIWIINPDLFAARIRVAENLSLSNVQAVTRIEAWLEASINAHQTVGVETVLSTDKYRRLVVAAKQRKLEFCLIYVMLESPDLNVERVRLRARKGGHDVPEAKQWARSLQQLPWFLEQADRAVIYDNYGAAQSHRIGRQYRADGAGRLARCAGHHVPMIIAIDGPAASGKGTLGKRLAAHYGLRHLDTGLLYRAVAQTLLAAGHRLDDVARAVAAAGALDPAQFDETGLKSHAAGEAASVVSAIPEVRAALLRLQQDYAAMPPGAVLDGRDIGTLICPQADAKIFVTAAPEVRARRRALEMRSQGEVADEAEILADIRCRDARDTARTVAPLRRAPDAQVLDTTSLDIEGVVRAAIAIVERARNAAARRSDLAGS
jgi:CMP/dCMP kinase